MFSTLIVARMDPEHIPDVSSLFTEFDTTDMPRRMGTLRRQLYHFHNLYFHVQDFNTSDGANRVETAKADPQFVKISTELRPFIDPFDPAWRSPQDAIATPFYYWEGQ